MRGWETIFRNSVRKSSLTDLKHVKRDARKHNRWVQFPACLFSGRITITCQIFTSALCSQKHWERLLECQWWPCEVTLPFQHGEPPSKQLVYGLGRAQRHMYCCTIPKYPLALKAHVHLLQHLPNPSMAKLWLTTTSSKLSPSLAVVVSRSPSRFIKCTVTWSLEL